MAFSSFLASRHDVCKKLVNKLLNNYEYVSLLGAHVEGSTIRVTTYLSSVGDSSERQCGFVLKLFNGINYSEYSFSDITEDTLESIYQDVLSKVTLPSSLTASHVNVKAMEDEVLVKNFERKLEGKRLSTKEIMKRLTAIKDKSDSLSDKIVQTMTMYSLYEVSKMFISKNKDLTQNYPWCSVLHYPFAREGNKMNGSINVSSKPSVIKSFEEVEARIEDTVKLSVDLLHAEMVEPGEYDIITDPSITGLIAHEAFGHGVEMDMFVKNRALAKDYVGKYVASPIVDMHDGAASCLSVASYFFDDDGVLAQDTTIIKDGILQTGMSDALSALQLGTKPTGNGRRESFARKAYTRMTNTWFARGKDKLEDMIASVKHGYLLCQTDNGMEDPKNWNIQCVCAYGREIVDGKFSGKLVAPVCMTGYVPDLLKSISMVSDDFVVDGFGHCGKGHKEWVTVSDGGPYLKARCKLG